MDLNCYENPNSIILENLEDIEYIHINNSDNKEYYNLIAENNNTSSDIYGNSNEYMSVLDNNIIDIIDQYVINENSINQKDISIKPKQSGNKIAGDIKYDCYDISYNNQNINDIPLESLINMVNNINYYQEVSDALNYLYSNYGVVYIQSLSINNLLHLINYVVANNKAVKAINYWNAIASNYRY